MDIDRGRLSVSSGLVTLLLQSVDALRRIVPAAVAGARELLPEDHSLLARLGGAPPLGSEPVLIDVREWLKLRAGQYKCEFDSRRCSEVSIVPGWSRHPLSEAVGLEEKSRSCRSSRWPW